MCVCPGFSTSSLLLFESLSKPFSLCLSNSVLSCWFLSLSIDLAAILCIVVTHISDWACTPSLQVKSLGHMLRRWGDKLSREKEQAALLKPVLIHWDWAIYFTSSKHKKTPLCLVGESRSRWRKKNVNTEEKRCLSASLPFSWRENIL